MVQIEHGPTSTDGIDEREAAALLARAGSGDQAAFGQLYDGTSARIYGSFMARLHDAGLAERATLDTFLDIWSNAARFRSDRTSASEWIGGFVLAHH